MSGLDAMADWLDAALFMTNVRRRLLCYAALACRRAVRCMLQFCIVLQHAPATVLQGAAHRWVSHIDALRVAAYSSARCP